MAAQHILIFVEDFAGGGVERVALELARRWIAAGREVTILAGRISGPLVAEIPAGARLIDLQARHYAGLGWGVIRMIRRLSPDILFCPGNYYSAIAVAARIALGRRCPPILCKISNAFDRRDMTPPARAAYHFWLRTHIRWIDRFVALSEPMRSEALELAGLDAGRIVAIPNPPARLPALRTASAHQQRFVLAVGRLSPQKRFHKLVEAFALLPATSDAELVILGEGPERSRIEDAAARLGVADRVHLPGYVADPLPAMAQARVVALSSGFEGSPGVLGEALAMGTPVVSTASSSTIGAILSDPILGSVVPIDDIAAMAAAIAGRLDHEPDRQAISAIAARRTSEGSSDLYLEHMDRLAARTGERADYRPHSYASIRPHAVHPE